MMKDVLFLIFILLFFFPLNNKEEKFSSFTEIRRNQWEQKMDHSESEAWSGKDCQYRVLWRPRLSYGQGKCGPSISVSHPFFIAYILAHEAHVLEHNLILYIKRR